VLWHLVGRAPLALPDLEAAPDQNGLNVIRISAEAKIGQNVMFYRQREDL